MTINTHSSLETQEEIVLNVVQEYLDKNRNFNMNRILPFINARFRNTTINVNNEGISRILKSLLEKKLILEGSKLTKFEILSIPKRKRIFEFVLKNPGTYHREIAQELRFANHVITWHLKMLVKFNFIKKTPIENKEIYYHYDLDFKYAIRYYYLRHKKIKIIINYLKPLNNEVSKTNISKNTGIHITTTGKYLKILESLNILVKKEKSNKKVYSLNLKKI